MPDWLLYMMVYVFVGGAMAAITIPRGDANCGAGYSHDSECPHRWIHVISSIIWPLGIPLLMGIWLAQVLRLGITREQRREDKYQRELAAARERENLAVARRRAAETETAALSAEIEATNLKLQQLQVPLAPLHTE